MRPIQVLRQKNNDELKTERDELSKELFLLNIKKRSGQVAGVDRFKKIKRNIARINMILSAKSDS